jgi:hypothetical protein
MNIQYQIFAYFNNHKYECDYRTGYFYRRLENDKRKAMHREIWEYYNGTIPDKHIIHHIDENKMNNDISNLECKHTRNHSVEHGKEFYKRNPEMYNTNLKKAVQKAKELHSKTHSKEWHKKHYENMKHKLHKKIKIKCVFCNKEYETIDNGKNRFCSNNCKSKWRRKQGLDLIEKECVVCGSKFKTNKNRPGETCGRSCTNKRMWERRRLQSGS